jgi:uncharacterized membrane protein
MTDRRLWQAAMVLSLVGIAIASYLVYIHYADVKPICSISHGCETVQKSKYAKLAGIPVALIGLLGYLAILASLFVRSETGRIAGAAFALIGVGFSAWLTYLEAARIHAWCQWCIASATVMTLLAITLVWRMLAAPALATPSDSRPSSPSSTHRRSTSTTRS